MGLNISGAIDRARNPERYPDRAQGPTFDTVCQQCHLFLIDYVSMFCIVRCTAFLMVENQKVNTTMIPE
jgi:hypothetical protein